MDKKEIVSKYMTFCGWAYEKASSFWEKKQERSPETIRKNQIRGTWLVSLIIAIAVLHVFFGEEEDEAFYSDPRTLAPVADAGKLGKAKSFSEIAVSWWSCRFGDDDFDNHVDADNGVAFFHGGISNAQVISVVDDGVIVGCKSTFSTEWNYAYVKTEDSGYVDGDRLKIGVYVRNGTYRYRSADGAVRTIPAFEKVTRKKDLEIFMALYEVQKNKIKEDSEKSKAKRK